MRTQLETRELVVGTLEAMMAEAPLRGITAKALCERAGISRTAFYRYFNGVNDVPRWLWEHIFNETAALACVEMSFREAHLLLFRRLGEHREFFARALRDEGIDSPVKLMNRSVLGDVMGRAVAAGDIHPTEAEALQVRFFHEGAVAMTRAWLLGDIQAGPEAMATCLASMAPSFWQDVIVAGR